MQGLTYAWSVSGPAGYTLPAATVTNQPDFNFTPDVAGTYAVTLTVGDSDPGDTATTVQAKFMVDPMSNTSLAAVLPQSSTTANELTIEATPNVSQDAVIGAVNALAAPQQPVTITLDLNGGTYNDTTVSPPA